MNRLLLQAYGMPPTTQVLGGLPPIVGDEGGSTWFGPAGYAMAGPLALPARVAQGLSFGVDVQPFAAGHHVLLGSEVSGRNAFRLSLGGPAHDEVVVEIRDRAGRDLRVRAHASRSRAKRLVVAAIPRENVVAVYEIQPWAEHPGRALPISIERADGPEDFGDEGPFAIGGCAVDGERQGPHNGRLANVFINDKLLTPDRVTSLTLASSNPTALAFSDVAAPGVELVSRFARDLARMRKWLDLPTMSTDDMDDAALLIHRLLFESQSLPVLVDLCRRCGIQLWLPGESERARHYAAAVAEHEPLFMINGARGPQAPMGFEWTTLDRWRDESVFLVQGRPVSCQSFVKFVRNKLGGGHFDERERTKWQRDLIDVDARMTLQDESALVWQMRALVSEVALAVEAAGLESAVC